jgi:hypothetical protein
MEQELLDRLNKIDEKLEETRSLASKTYKMFLWTVIGSIVTFVLPLIALAFVIPYFMRTITSSLGGL